MMSATAFGVDIAREQICVVPGSPSKSDALDQLVDAVAVSDAIRDKEAFRRAVHDREAVDSTGIGNGIAIPHVRIAAVTHPVIGVGIVPGGVEFKSIDKKPVYVMVLFATPVEAGKEYLGMLAKVMMALKNEPFYERLVNCRTPDEAYEILTG